MIKVTNEKLEKKTHSTLQIGYPNRTAIHFLQESVKFHFQDFGRQMRYSCRYLERSWKKMSDLSTNVNLVSNLENEPDLQSNLEENV